MHGPPFAPRRVLERSRFCPTRPLVFFLEAPSKLRHADFGPFRPTRLESTGLKRKFTPSAGSSLPACPGPTLPARCRAVTAAAAGRQLTPYPSCEKTTAEPFALNGYARTSGAGRDQAGDHRWDRQTRQPGRYPGRSQVQLTPHRNAATLLQATGLHCPHPDEADC